jgi:hypothetical protein
VRKSKDNFESKLQSINFNISYPKAVLLYQKVRDNVFIAILLNMHYFLIKKEKEKRKKKRATYPR